MTAVIAFLGAHAFTVISWLIRIGALVVVPFRRSAAESRTWLLGFFVAPVPALLIYLVIGRPQHSKSRQELFGKLPGVLERTIARGGLDIDAITANPRESIKSSTNLAMSLSQLPVVRGNSVRMLPDYDGSIAELVADIDAARQHVHLEFYIFANDATGRQVMAAVERAHKRGVKCRILIDAMGSMRSARAVEKRLKKSGVDVYRILPLARRLRSSRIDLRNHRKIAVIDGDIGYTGSQNIVDAAINAKLANKELMVRVEGPVVGELQAVFIGDWFLETEQEIKDEGLFSSTQPDGEVNAQLLPSGPDYSSGIDLFFTNAIYDATQEIVLVTPYFIPNTALIAALKTAALRGANVKLILSAKSDSIPVYLAQRSYYSEMLEAGVEIFLYKTDFLHAKHMRIDESITIIGSSNMDQRSFELNAEVSLICYGAKTAQDLRIVENTYFVNCEAISKHEWQARPLLVKLVENMARLISDLL